MKSLILFVFCALTLFHLPSQIFGEENTNIAEQDCLPEYRFDGKKLVLTEKEWKARLTPEQFKILREGGTEAPFRNAYFDNKAKGIYVCAGCALPLFSSNTKFDSGTGWPSFWQPICPRNVTLTQKGIWFFEKTEVSCSRCGGHLGDLFNDGPQPTGKRYCIDSTSLKFIPK